MRWNLKPFYITIKKDLQVEMETINVAREILERLKELFIQYEVKGWIIKTDEALNKLSGEKPNLKRILYNYQGAGMGSLSDLFICKKNGHKIEGNPDEANKELTRLGDALFTVYYRLR